MHRSLINEKFDALALGPDGYIYAATSVWDSPGHGGGGRILRYDQTTGDLVDELTPLGGSGLYYPAGLAFDQAGDLYVANNLPGGGVDEVLKFSGGAGFDVHFRLYAT